MKLPNAKRKYEKKEKVKKSNKKSIHNSINQPINVFTLGFPVLPLVYMMMAISSGPGGTEIDVTGPFQYRDRRHGTFSYRDRRHGTLPIQR